MNTDLPTTRRDFLKTAAATSAVLAASAALNAQSAGTDEIKVGIVGCGGRGSGAAENVLQSAKGVKIVALGDVFKEKPDGLRRRLARLTQSDAKMKELGNSTDITDDRVFTGLDAYEKVINCPEVNYIILATPPGFRPLHIQAAVASGKNLFTEKPVGVDGTGIRKVMAAYEDSLKKGMHIVTGTQRRHQLGYVEMMKRVKDGAIGDIKEVRAYWNGGDIWFRDRKPGMTDTAYQLDNWYHFVWVCGDHIVEQHVHNLDVANWAMGGPPAKCVGMGFRAARRPGDPNVVGHIYDFFAIDYEYPNGVHMQSTCRQIRGTDNNVSEALVGTKGSTYSTSGTQRINNQAILNREQSRAAVDPYVQEHTDLIACIRDGKPVNELKQVAESTLTAIMGRMSAYTGKPVTFEQALNSKLDTYPAHLTWDSSLPVSPVPVPGRTPLV